MITIKFECIMPDCKNFGVIKCSETLKLKVKCGICGSDMIFVDKLSSINAEDYIIKEVE